MQYNKCWRICSIVSLLSVTLNSVQADPVQNSFADNRVSVVSARQLQGGSENGTTSQASTPTPTPLLPTAEFTRDNLDYCRDVLTRQIERPVGVCFPLLDAMGREVESRAENPAFRSLVPVEVFEYLTDEDNVTQAQALLMAGLPEEGSGDTDVDRLFFSEGSVKGFISNFAHRNIVGHKSGDGRNKKRSAEYASHDGQDRSRRQMRLPDTSNPLRRYCERTEFESEQARTGCRLLITDVLINDPQTLFNTDLEIEKWVFTLTDKNQLERLKEWNDSLNAEDLKENDRFFPIVAIYGHIPLDGTLRIEQVGSLIGIPSVAGEFDPDAQLTPSQKPKLYTTEQFASDCEKFTPAPYVYGEDYSEVYCSAFGSRSVAPNAMISMLSPVAVGVDFSATLREVSLNFMPWSARRTTTPVKRTFPAVLINANWEDFDFNTYDYFASVLYGSDISLTKLESLDRPELSGQYRERANLGLRLDSFPYEVYATGFFSAGRKYLISKNSVKVQDCLTMSDVATESETLVNTEYLFPTLRADNTLQDFTGVSCSLLRGEGQGGSTVGSSSLSRVAVPTGVVTAAAVLVMMLR